MRAPEIAYRFGLNDFRSLTFETVHRSGDTQANSALISEVLLSALAKDRVLVISNVWWEVIPDATTGVVRVTPGLTTGAGRAFNIMREVYAATADTPVSGEWWGEIYVTGAGPVLSTVTVAVTFSGAAAGNRLISGFSGVVIPRGNIGNH